MRSALRRRSRAASASTPITCCRRSKTRPNACCKEGELPAEHRSERSARSTIRTSARASCACSSASSARRRVTCCRCSAGTRRPQPAGSARSGSSRRGRLFLAPGDSPIGFRLPLSSLPHVKPVDYPLSRAGRSRFARPRRAAGSETPRSHRRRSRTLAPAPGRAAIPPCRRAAVPQTVSSRRRAAGRAGAHRADGRAARRPAVRVHAAGRASWRIISSCSPSSRRPPTSSSMPVHIEGYAPPPDPRSNVIKVTPDPGVIEVNVHPAASWREAVDITRTLYEEARHLPARHRQVHDRRPPHRHRRRQSRRARRRRRRRTARSCAGPICSRAWSCTGSGIRRCPICSPACSSARPARRRASTRRATTSSTSWRSRWRTVPRAGRGRAAAAMAGRPPVPQSPGRRHRQHPPRRDLHRQAVLARRPDRPARPGRIPLVRDAAGRAHEPGAAIAAARADRLVLARAAATARWCAGAPRCTTASCCRISSGRIFSACSRICGGAGYRFRSGLVRGAARVPLSVLRRGRARRRAAGAAPGAGALARAGRGGHRRRHGALRRFLGRAAAGQGRGSQRRAATSSPATAAACR